MGSLKLQFFLLYGSFAAVQPYLALLLIGRGMEPEEVGYTMGVSGWALMLSPALATLAADMRAQPRRLVTGLCAAAVLSLGALWLAEGHWALVGCFFVYSLAMAALVPLQDGVAFGYGRLLEEQGRAGLDYNEVRVWGTYGYMALLALLFYPVRHFGSVEVALVFGIGCIGALLLNSLALPERGRRETAKRAALPTSESLRTLFRGRTWLFSLGMFLLLMASAGYHTMYPVFLAEDIGVAPHWLGIVVMAGALGEVFYIRALSGWQRRWGMRAVMLGGIALTLLRFGLMYSFPNAWVAIGTQVLHGAMICAMMVLPPAFLNGLASESNGNSIQGVYAMAIVGTSRLVGSALSGHVAAVGQREVYLLCFALTAAAFAAMWAGLGPALPKARAG